MLTRLGYYADKAIEIGWLGAAICAPLFFNVYSSRVFEPDKIALLRSIVLLMTAAWLIKLVEGGWRAMREAEGTGASKLGAAMQGAAQSGLPSWLGFLRVPMVAFIFIYALVYLISSIFTMTPEATWLGSYQRLQGTYSQFSYMTLCLLVIANMRTRKQLERLISFILLATIPVVIYGLLQANRLDPLPWAGDTATRVASTMGNAIFVAAWLIMVVPFTIYRLFNGVSAMMASRSREPEEAESDNARRRPTIRRAPAYREAEYGWAVIADVVGILLIELFLFLFALNLVAGLPFPDAALWPAVPSALFVFYVGCWLIEWLGNHSNDPNQARIYLIVIGALVFLSALCAFALKWDIDRNTIRAVVEFDGSELALRLVASAVAPWLLWLVGRRRNVRWIAGTMSAIALAIAIFVELLNGGGFLWVLFFSFAWAAVAGIAYFFGSQSDEARDPNRGLLPVALNTGYGLLLALQLLCIYLTQSRGPWLGVALGLVAYAVALWLVGRRRNVRWMARIGGAASAIALTMAIFVGLLNIPGSPLQSLGGLPIVGRGIERLSTLFRTEDGTGKVRTLIWQGATDLIISDPLRAVIGYGPEAMYVVYNKFYPAELAQWELRNATPDRSHNVEFDQMVTMGVMGLFAYYALLAAFFIYSLKIIKRAATTRDQLLGITLMSVVATHFIEIQTGIQIASTWTYFYLAIGMMVTFGYFMTGHLHSEGAMGEANVSKMEQSGRSDGKVMAPTGAGMTSAMTGARQSATAVGARGQSQKSVPLGTGGKATATTGVYGSKTNTGRQTGRNGGQTPDAKRRQGQSQPRMQINAADTSWISKPALVPLYVALLLGMFWFIQIVNRATVEADTLYKQGQSYDQAAQWSNSIRRYDQAIALQPNQDYYYLFRGRAYLERSKQVDQEMGSSYTQQQKDAERTVRLQRAELDLSRARDLNPLNTDHYANLGRLYLQWSDTGQAGGKDPKKAPLAIENLHEATVRSPGNAQLWNELAVAYGRDGMFDKAIETLSYSQDEVDSRYARTPYMRGQLLQERASNVKNALISDSPLPAGGETDYGKLVLAAGDAYSESISLDPAFFVDNGMQARVDYFLEAGRPFTGTNSTISPVELSNVLTTTVVQAYEQLVDGYEKELSDYLRSRGEYNGEGNKVPITLLDELWKKPGWVGIRPTGSTGEWLDDPILTLSRKAVVPYAALGYMYYTLGERYNTPSRVTEATEAYRRAVALDPSNYFNQKNLGSLLAEKQGLTEEGLAHLQAALKIIESQPDLANDSEKQQNYQEIQQAIQRVQP